MNSLFSKYRKAPKWASGHMKAAIKAAKRMSKPPNRRPMGLRKSYQNAKRSFEIWNPKTIGKTSIKNPKLHWSKKGAKRTKQQQLWYRDRAKANWMKEHGWKWTFGRRPR